MRITKHTDYALRVLMFLAVRPGQRIPTQSIADGYEISLDHLLKICRKLGELGYLHLHRGAKGGLELAMDPDEISVGAVMRALDDQAGLLECFTPATNTCVVSPVCGLKGALRNAQEAFYENLDGVWLGTLVRPKLSKLRKLTGG